METIELKDALRDNISVVEELLDPFSIMDIYSGDLNKCVKPGLYYYYTESEIMNSPILGFGCNMLVLACPNSMISQILIPYKNPGILYIRNCSKNTVWTEWSILTASPIK